MPGQFELTHANGKPVVLLDGQDITSAIKDDGLTIHYTMGVPIVTLTLRPDHVTVTIIGLEAKQPDRDAINQAMAE